MPKNVSLLQPGDYVLVDYINVPAEEVAQKAGIVPSCFGTVVEVDADLCVIDLDNDKGRVAIPMRWQRKGWLRRVI